MVALQLRSNVRMTPEVARFVAELIREPTLYSEHRRSDDNQVSVERHTFTTMDEQQRLLADAVERIAGGSRPGEPFTVRELVILSPYTRERSAAGHAVVDTRDGCPPHLTPRGCCFELSHRRPHAHPMGHDPRGQAPWGAGGQSDRRQPFEAVPPRSALRRGVARYGSVCGLGQRCRIGLDLDCANKANSGRARVRISAEPFVRGW